MQRQENNQPGYAGFFVRLAAYLVDTLIIGIGSFFISATGLFWNIGTGFLSAPVLFQYKIDDILFYLLGAAYYILMTYSAGATLGKRIFNLRVVSADGQKLTFFNVLYRETIGKYLSGVIMNAGYIAIGVDIEKRGFHDMLCDTRVVYEIKPGYGTYHPYNGGNESTSYDVRPPQESRKPYSLTPQEESRLPAEQKEPFSPPPYANDQNPPWKKKQEKPVEAPQNNQLETERESNPDSVNWDTSKESDENKKN